MCGIYGFVTTHSGPSPSLDVALSALRHRGPDDTGTYEHADGAVRCGFAHTRLAILDPTPSGRQPMRSADGRFTLVYNGEVYNFPRLRKLLEAAGCRFESSCDTEVVLAAFARWGPRCVEQFRGMFALAVWDARERRLWLARDRLGIKPLYVQLGPGRIAFASEVRALLDTSAAPRRLDIDSVTAYLALGSVAEPTTIVQGIEAVPPGSLLAWEPGGVRRERYWTLPEETRCDVQPEQARDEVRRELEEAVRLRLVADVPLGLFLSGGIDSAALVALASRVATTRLTTFTVTFDEASFDESSHAGAIAARFGTDHHEVRVSAAQAALHLQDVVAAMDQPTSDGINTFVVSAAARSAGLKVALSGIGGDELFAGYSYFRAFGPLSRAAQVVGRMPRAHHAADAMSAWPALPVRMGKLALAMATRGDRGAVYSALRGMFSPAEREALTGNRSIYSAREPDGWPTGEHGAGPDAVHAYSALEISNYLRNTLLRDADVMSMAHGLEIRVPLLDHRVVELALTLPGAHKLRRFGGNKPLLVDAARDLPHGIGARRKMGFSFPLETWFRGPLRQSVEERLMAGVRHMGLLRISEVERLWRAFLRGRRGLSSRIWTLLALGEWSVRHRMSA